MSARQRCWIECEGRLDDGSQCVATYPAAAIAGNVADVRRDARNAGWVTGGPGSPDLCFMCVHRRRERRLADRLSPKETR